MGRATGGLGLRDNQRPLGTDRTEGQLPLAVVGGGSQERRSSDVAWPGCEASCCQHHASPLRCLTHLCRARGWGGGFSRGLELPGDGLVGEKPGSPKLTEPGLSRPAPGAHSPAQGGPGHSAGRGGGSGNTSGEGTPGGWDSEGHGPPSSSDALATPRMPAGSICEMLTARSWLNGPSSSL